MLQAALKLKTIPGLDATRAVAVMLVVAFHYYLLPSAAGELGVMAFFVLSGFLITRILIVEFGKTGDISLREFYRKRAFRIMPTFYACWLMETLLITFHHEQIRWWEPWASFFFLTDYARAIAGPYTIHHMGIAWSLAVEEQFYLLWPAILAWMLISGKKAWKYVAIFIPVIWVYRAILHGGLHVSYEYIYNAFDTRIDALMMGSLLALLTEDAKNNVRSEKLLAFCTRSPWLAVVPIGGLLVSGAFDKSIKAMPWVSMASFSMQPVLIAMLLIQCVCFGNAQWRILANPVLRFIAKISYALYLYHALVFEEGQRISLAGTSGSFLGFRYMAPDQHPRVALVIIPALLIPVISYFVIEKPFMWLRDRPRTRVKQTEQEVAPVATS